MFEHFMYNYGNQLLMAALCAIFGVLGYGLKQLCKAWLDSADKVSVARIAAQFVEQAWRELHGKDKLAKALETAEELLKKKHIPFDADEMMVLIEAAVAEFNEAFKRPLTDAATAEAVRRVEDGADTVVSGFLQV